MRGLGQDVIYEAFLKEVQANRREYIILDRKIESNEKLDSFLEEIDHISKPTLVILSLSIGSGAFRLFEKLNQQREVKRTKFVCIIFSNITEVYESIKRNVKIVTRCLHILVPLSKKDSIKLLHSFEKRFKYTLDQKAKEEITALSGGHVGIIKAIFMYCKNNSQSQINVKDLLLDQGVIYRLRSISEDVPGNIFNPSNSEFFERFGITKDKHPFSELLVDYLKSIKIGQNESYVSFTPNENLIFKSLTQNINNILSREEISHLLWGELWEQKSSDWAIDQLVHRLRIKIRKNKLLYKIVTNKGIGFTLLHK